MKCPRCDSENTVKNGSTHNGKLKRQCNDCGRQFVLEPENKIPEWKCEIIDRLLLEKISLAGIARSMQVSDRWLQEYVNNKYEETPKKIQVTPKEPGQIIVQADELWSFVGNKGNKYWVWLALDVETREIVGLHIGKRTKKDARQLWNSLPPVYRQCAIFYTDFLESYASVFPANRHRAVGKETGLTSYIERFNNTVRQRVSRLVRKTLSFSKKVPNHMGAIWYFINHYNSELAIKMCDLISHSLADSVKNMNNLKKLE